MRLNDSEWTVMRALWEARAASNEVTARDVHGRIADETEWAYTTLRTFLARLVEKGAIAERKIGNQSVYEPLITQEEAQTSAVRSLLERAFDGTVGSLLQHLAGRERLSKADRERLAALIDEGIDEADRPQTTGRPAKANAKAAPAPPKGRRR